MARTIDKATPRSSCVHSPNTEPVYVRVELFARGGVTTLSPWHRAGCWLRCPYLSETVCLRFNPAWLGVPQSGYLPGDLREWRRAALRPHPRSHADRGAGTRTGWKER